MQNVEMEYLYLLDLKTDIEAKLSHPEEWQPWQIAVLEMDLDTINNELAKLK